MSKRNRNFIDDQEGDELKLSPISVTSYGEVFQQLHLPKINERKKTFAFKDSILKLTAEEIRNQITCSSQKKEKLKKICPHGDGYPLRYLENPGLKVSNNRLKALYPFTSSPNQDNHPNIRTGAQHQDSFDFKDKDSQDIQGEENSRGCWEETLMPSLQIKYQNSPDDLRSISSPSSGSDYSPKDH